MRSWVALTSVFLAAFLPGLSFAQNEEQLVEFEQLKQDAKKALDEGDMDLAIELLERALTIIPTDPVVMKELARIYRDAKRLDEAEVLYRRYLDTYPEASDRGRIEHYLKEIEREREAAIPTVEINSKPADASIYLGGCDGKFLGKTPLTITLPPQHHLLCGKSTGYETFEQQILAESGKHLIIDWNFIPLPPKDVTLLISGWTLVGVGVISLGVALGFQLDRDDLHRQAEDCWEQRQTDQCSREQYDELVQEIEDDTSGKVALGLWVAGGVLLAGGIALILWDALETDGGEGDVSFVPLLGPDTMGLSLSFSFN